MTADPKELGEHLLRTVWKGMTIGNCLFPPKGHDEGYFDLLKEAVEAEGLDINYEDIYGRTALMMAADRGDVETVKYLISKGAEPNSRCLQNIVGRGKRKALLTL